MKTYTLRIRKQVVAKCKLKYKPVYGSNEYWLALETFKERLTREGIKADEIRCRLVGRRVTSLLALLVSSPTLSKTSLKLLLSSNSLKYINIITSILLILTSLVLLLTYSL